MWNVDQAEYLQSGYVILRGMIAPEELDGLRHSFEQVVRRQYPDGPAPGRPPCQPRVFEFERFFDSSSTAAAEFCMHDSIMTTTQQLLEVETAGLAYLYMMCNPLRDYGPWFWHRDHSYFHGPLLGMQRDFLENGPDHLQWNITLYDDDVFWVVPGSHIRPNTAAEDRQLAAVPHSCANRDEPAPGSTRHTPLPDSVGVDLKAGDGVAYDTMLLHWGSNYSARHRRVIHIGTRGLRARRYYHDFCTSDNVAPYLSVAKRAEYELAQQLHREEQGQLRATFRAIVDRDEDRFREGLALLHPGIPLCGLIKLDILVRNWRRQPNPPLEPDVLETLWQHFAPLKEAMKVEGGRLPARLPDTRAHPLPPLRNARKV